MRSAIVNCGFEFPLKRITANLAPADLRKAGPGFDLAIAAAILCASGQIAAGAARRLVAGRRARPRRLDPLPAGRAGDGRGGLAQGWRRGRRRRRERGGGQPGRGPRSRGAELARRPAAPGGGRGARPSATAAADGSGPPPPDLADLRGQTGLRHGLEVAAAGGHGLLVVGPPGAGKSLAARRLPSILPPLGRAEAVEVTKIASAAGRPPPDGSLAARPFRAPHHTISAAGLVGGGSPPRPGEITLAHRGVLFLDELGEFARSSLEALRQPLEDGRVTIARAQGALTFPARFQIVAAANPCPCGHGEASSKCLCSKDRIGAYESRLSGALADRFDLSLRVEQPDAGSLAGDPGEPSAVVAERVLAARERQEARLGAARTNASMSEAELALHAALDAAGAKVLDEGHSSMGLSGRGWNRVLKVARTLADLEGHERIARRGRRHGAVAAAPGHGRNMRACRACTSRGLLLASLAAHLDRGVDRRTGGRARDVLALDDESLAAAMAPDDGAERLRRARSDEAHERLEDRLAGAGCWSTCAHRDGYPRIARRARRRGRPGRCSPPGTATSSAGCSRNAR